MYNALVQTKKATRHTMDIHKSPFKTGTLWMGLAFAALDHYLPPAASRHSFAPFGLRRGAFSPRLRGESTGWQLLARQIWSA